MKKKILYVLCGLFAILMPLVVLKGVLEEMYVKQNGKVIKAVLVETTSHLDKSFFFKYNNIKFSNRKYSVYYNRNKNKIGDTLSFFYLPTKTNIFVPTEKQEKDFYIEITIYIMFIVTGIYILFYVFFILSKNK